MPVYDLQCANGHRFDRYIALDSLDQPLSRQCLCGEIASVLISAPIMVKACADVCYDSPIDGRPITSWQSRQEDLKRNHCSPYDPEQKTDLLRRRKEAEDAMDKRVDTFVEQTVEKMPTKARAKLYSEVTEQGKDAVIERRTKTA